MSSTEVVSSVIKNLCYCCQDNLSSTFLWKTEGSHNVSYGLMLQNCFSLQLDIANEDVICNQCICDLQAAVEFRNKVAEARQDLILQTLDVKKSEEFKFDVQIKQECDGFQGYDEDMERKALDIIIEEQKNPTQKTNLIINTEDLTKTKDQYLCNKKVMKNKNVHKKSVCDTCGVQFSNETNLKDHKNTSCSALVLLRNSGGLKICTVPLKIEGVTFSCSDCSKHFSSKRALVMHQRIHKGTSKKPNNVGNNTNTSKNHKDKKVFENLPAVEAQKVQKVTYKVLPGDYTKVDKTYTCNKCQRTTNEYSIMMRHINNVHYKNPAYNCLECKEVFTSLHKLNEHKFNIHNNSEGRYPCTACDGVFYTLTTLNGHTKSYHMLGDILKCPECDFETYLRQGMRHHMAKHNKKVQYFCRFCPKAFTRRDSHKYHERIHTGDKRKVCKICGEKFVQRTSLKYHIVKHHPNENVL